MNEIEIQKARIIRATAMAKRALDRGDTGQVDAWVGQFKREVARLNEIDPR